MAPSKVTATKGKSIPSRKVAPNPIAARKTAKKKNEKSLKLVFQGLTISFAGTITDTSGDAFSYEKMAKWITFHGGKYEREVTAQTTHLICSIEEYKKKGPQVLKAWEYSSKYNQCFILVFDWLEDSLNGPKGSKKKRAEKGYTLDRTIARIKKGKNDHIAFRQRFEDGLRASKELCDNKLHKVHFDQDGFEYKIMLTRIDLSNEKPKVEKYTLFLFESIAIPHTYMTGAKLSRSHRPISYYRENCHPKPFPDAMRDFKHFFYDKTRIAWDARLEGIKIANAFVYTPPVVGRPVGLLPFGYVRPEQRPVVISESETESGSGSGSGSGNDSSTTTSTSGSDNVYDTDSEVDDSSSEDSLSTSTTRKPKSPSSSQESATIYASSPQGNVFDGYGYQPNVVDLRTPTISPNSSFGTQYNESGGENQSEDDQGVEN